MYLVGAELSEEETQRPLWEESTPSKDFCDNLLGRCQYSCVSVPLRTGSRCPRRQLSLDTSDAAQNATTNRAPQAYNWTSFSSEEAGVTDMVNSSFPRDLY